METEPAEKKRRNLSIAAIVAAVLVGGVLLYFTRVGGFWKLVDSVFLGSDSGETALADLVVGRYSGSVIADSKGSARSDIDVTLTKVGPGTVRVSSPYGRIGTFDIEVQKTGNRVLQVGGDTPFIVDLDAKPPTLSLSPRNELSYQGVRRK